MKTNSIKSSALILFVITLFTFSGCKDNNFLPSTRDADEKELKTLLDEIQKMSAAETCTNSSEWKFVPIGSQACGGTIGFIPYSVKINTDQFLQKVEVYTNKQKAFIAKYKVVSTCAIILPPKGVECIDGKPKLIY
ncbi:hypothetical protein [Pedobacter punctiformis]|uniref:Lipoprotein n=1 Tax=Pedobacter punctiformis TaxID=3004097 RepID=A0ABT4L479_9SPHI|nr:hypothetical protein [Pedobacter sp. HCMS5-2]MCZ4242507.1 hypothetical protein [Pedobacter sp. HCMS5-2]